MAVAAAERARDGFATVAVVLREAGRRGLGVIRHPQRAAPARAQGEAVAGGGVEAAALLRARRDRHPVLAEVVRVLPSRVGQPAAARSLREGVGGERLFVGRLGDQGRGGVVVFRGGLRVLVRVGRAAPAVRLVAVLEYWLGAVGAAVCARALGMAEKRAAAAARRGVVVLRRGLRVLVRVGRAAPAVRLVAVLGAVGATVLARTLGVAVPRAAAAGRELDGRLAHSVHSRARVAVGVRAELVALAFAERGVTGILDIGAVDLLVVALPLRHAVLVRESGVAGANRLGVVVRDLHHRHAVQHLDELAHGVAALCRGGGPRNRGDRDDGKSLHGLEDSS